MKEKPLNPRQKTILEKISREGEVSVQGLSTQFGVTPMTVRRDLETLERRGDLARTHGGAILTKPAVIEFEFLERNRTSLAEKQAIAREVAESIEPGTTLTIDTGTTTLEVARAISGIPGLKVLTSSLAIASVLHAHDNIDLVLLGGNARKSSPDLFGPLTEENLLQFRTNLAILGADAADRDGLYTTDPETARVSKAIIAGSETVTLVADSGKFGKTSFVKYAEWGKILRVVTDGGIGANHRRWLKKAVAEVHFAKI